MPHALGLFVFPATAAVLVAVLIGRLAGGLGSLEAVATAFSLAVAAIACFAMLVDAIDAWVKGGTMTRQGRMMFRSLVTVALIAAAATATLGGTLSLMVILLPALLVYLFIARRSLSLWASPRGGTGGGAPAATSPRESSGGRPATPPKPSRSRQRRGGKKRS